MYDCFRFNNELDLLEIRLNILYDKIEKFIIMEATRTSSGLIKPLYFEQNKDRFKWAEDKIVYLVCDKLSVPNGIYQINWDNENIQRNCAIDFLNKNPPQDGLILKSDLDEITDPDILNEDTFNLVRKNKIINIRHNFYYYYLNNMAINHYDQTTAIGDLNQLDYSHISPNNGKITIHGGWHWSFLGNAEFIENKIKSYAHQELISYANKEWIENILKNPSLDLFERDIHFKITDMGIGYPDYIIRNLQKYRKYIYLD
jgi:beta-1,4-mannosyl-glycoprotein beta-1,4-N-acetylglucosaminyltransferase